MKRLFKFLFMSSCVIAVIFGSTYVIFGDRYLPWVKKEIVYIGIHADDGIQQATTNHYYYETNGVTPQGKKRLVTFKSPQKMTKDVYLKLVLKGNYIVSSVVVEQRAMPNKVFNRLQ
ncbi:YxeA family protein [Kurthia sibirica]|uniref:YxeA family protein n=1 Tax=Kurthia sibirica TaxID=202750 RepID=UPI0011670003|nr:YxeA family protein [Kurthia sibirica]GEK34016.1 hypothetical protein KSI01_15490 [Kurthia sibirica]